MGAVFAAVHEKTGDPVAVKLIAQHIADEPRFRSRFDFEIKTLQRLRHKGIVRLIGFGEEQGQLFYSMELVEGESLLKRIRREKTIDWRATLDIAIQICSALKHAHDIGVIHRDLKPANLILTKDSSVKLVDFGIAKIFGDGEQTVAGSVLGTADYMAPEQADSSGVTHRTDLYAVGSLMYAMLTGRPPFSGKKITEVIESLKRDRPVPLDLVKPELPEALVELVHQLLEKDQADRPPTALAVMNRLKAMRVGLQREQTVVLKDSPTAVGTPSAGEPDAGDTGVQLDSDIPTGIAEDPTRVRRKKTVVSKGGGERKRVVSPHDVTVDSGSDSSKTKRPSSSDPEGSDPAAKTHFQTVSDSQPSTGIFQSESSAPATGWTQWLTIAGMLGVLIIGGGLVIYAFRPPTADQLYQAVIMTSDKDAAKTFMRSFPEDDRYDEILNLHMASRLTSVLNRLRVKAKLGIATLEAAEEGFVNAMQGRAQDPVGSMARLQNWLDVYDNQDNEADPMLKELMELAKHEHRQLAIREPEIIVDPRARDLIDDILQSVADQNPEASRKKLSGIIETFAHAGWATPAVEEAKRQLEILKD
jgi:serine/threonine protein kinase